MTAAEVIEEIKQLSPSDQSHVIEFVFQLTRTRQIAGIEAASVAQRKAEDKDQAAVEKPKTALS